MRLSAIKIGNVILKLNEITMDKLDKCLYKKKQYNSKRISNRQYKISGLVFNIDNNGLRSISDIDKIEDSAKDIIFIDNLNNENTIASIYNLMRLVSCDFSKDSKDAIEVIGNLYENVECKAYFIFDTKIIELCIKNEIKSK